MSINCCTCCLHESVKTRLGPCCNQNFIFNDLCNYGCMKCFYCQIKCICIDTFKELQKKERYSVFDGGHGLMFTYEELLQEKIRKKYVKPKSGMRMLKASVSSDYSEQSFSGQQSRKGRKRRRKTIKNGLVRYSSPSRIPKFDGDKNLKISSDKQKKRKTRSEDSEIFRKSHSPKTEERKSIKDKQRSKTVSRSDEIEIFHKSKSPKTEGKKSIKNTQKRKTGSGSDDNDIFDKSIKAEGRKSNKDKQKSKTRSVSDNNEIVQKSIKAEGRKSIRDKQRIKAGSGSDDNKIVRKLIKAGEKKSTKDKQKSKTGSDDNEIVRKSIKAEERKSIKDKQRNKTGSVSDDNEIVHKSIKAEGRKSIRDKQRRKTESETNDTGTPRKSNLPKAEGRKSTKEKQKRTIPNNSKSFLKLSKAGGIKSMKDKRRRKTGSDVNEIVRKSIKVEGRDLTKDIQKRKTLLDDGATFLKSQISKTEVRKSIKNKQKKGKPGSLRFVPSKTNQNGKFKIKIGDDETGKIKNPQEIQRKNKADSNFETFEINLIYFDEDSKGKGISKKPKDKPKKISILKQKSRVDDIKICDILRTQMENKYLNMKRDQIDCICPPVICKVDCQNVCPDVNKLCYLCCVDPCGTKCY